MLRFSTLSRDKEKGGRAAYLDDYDRTVVSLSALDNRLTIA